jgi:hypothetical protein
MAVHRMTCVHKWQIDRHNVGTCSVCGEVRQFPMEKGQEPVTLKPGRPTNKRTREKAPTAALRTNAKARYYRENRDAITQDIRTTGRIATCQKWDIPEKTYYKLISRWLTPDESAHQPNGHFPDLPEFSNTWDATVQVKWLDVYEKLHPKEEPCNEESGPSK